MANLEIFFLGLALAIDAAVVTFALSLLNSHQILKVRIMRALLCSLLFGFFQFLMVWIGSQGGYFFSFSKWGFLYPTLVSMIFFILGMKFFHESSKKEKLELNWSFFPLIALGVATSIDALASGVSLGVLPRTYLIALDIGFITFFVCAIFATLAHFFKNIPDHWLLRFGGVIFMGLGVNALRSLLF